MAKLGLLFPYEDMAQMADKIIEEQNIDVAYKKVIQTVDAVQEAREAVEAGADIIVARGYQAMLIKKHTKIPIVEMRLHAQEIGILLKKARVMVKKDTPRVGMIVFQNILSDMSCMEELFDVKLLIKYMDRMEDASKNLCELSEEGIDIVIGGEVVCEEAQKMGYLSLLYKSSVESITEALREADRMAYAMDVEKQNEAQFETILDTTFNGIIKINADGNITIINKLVENLLGKNLEEVVGLPIMELFPDFDKKAIWGVLEGKRDSYTISVNLRQQAWILLIAPIQYDDHITGAILSLQKISERIHRNSSVRRDMYLYGFVARTAFRDIYTENEEMKNQMELAKKYALSDLPVLIYGEEGTEYIAFGEAIHNNSDRKSGPFVSVNMHALEPEKQMEMLFGADQPAESEENNKRAAMIRANHGTIFISGIEYMNLQVQYHIARMIAQMILPNGLGRTDIQMTHELDVRIIVSSKINLRVLVDKGVFSEKLFYMLQGLMLEIPPLKNRPEDLFYHFEKYFKEYSKKYNKYLVATVRGNA